MERSSRPRVKCGVSAGLGRACSERWGSIARGTAFGALCAVTALCEIPTHLVSPRKRKTHFGLDADKEKSRALAIRLWPGSGLFVGRAAPVFGSFGEGV